MVPDTKPTRLEDRVKAQSFLRQDATPITACDQISEGDIVATLEYNPGPLYLDHRIRVDRVGDVTPIEGGIRYIAGQVRIVLIDPYPLAERYRCEGWGPHGSWVLKDQMVEEGLVFKLRDNSPLTKEYTTSVEPVIDKVA